MIPVVGRCLGAGEKQQAKRYAVRLLGIAMVGMAASSVVLYFGAPLFCRLFNLTAEATVMCEQVLRWFAVFSIFFWATSFTLPNALRAGGDAKFTMAVSMVSMWLFRVMLCYVFVQSFHMGLLGVWLGMFIDWICPQSAVSHPVCSRAVDRASGYLTCAAAAGQFNPPVFTPKLRFAQGKKAFRKESFCGQGKAPSSPGREDGAFSFFFFPFLFGLRLGIKPRLCVRPPS